MILTVQDFFAVGLGLDLAGGYLVARGLLADEADIATSRTIAWMGAQATVSKVSDRVDARFGLLYLLLGFGLQVVGYIAEEAGLEPGPTGWPPALTFLLLTAVALVAALLVHRRLAPALTRALALRVARLDGYGLPASEPNGRELMELGVKLGTEAMQGESYGEYAQRFWKIDRVSDADEVPDHLTERARRQPGPRDREGTTTRRE